MKITNVRACQPVAANSPPDWRTSLGQILVAVDTDAGLTGYGVGGGGWASIHTVQTVLRDLLLGKDPEQIESLWETMYRGTLAYGQKGLVVMAISGVDLALWDLRGRSQRAPVFELLGGMRHQTMPTYVTVWTRDALRAAADGGHQGFKLHLEKYGEIDARAEDGPEQLERQLQGARETIGEDAELMADAWMRWDLPTTRAMLPALHRQRLSWLEEPLPIDDEAGYRELAETSPVPIAGGEHEYTAAAFERLAGLRLHQVLQPDVCWVGGLTELIRIYAIGEQHGLRVCPHRGAELWSLHALAALDPRPLAESGRSWISWLPGQPPIVDGVIRPPSGPGLGHGIDEDQLKILPPPVSRW